jgi:hypothetical protein
MKTLRRIAGRVLFGGGVLLGFYAGATGAWLALAGDWPGAWGLGLVALLFALVAWAGVRLGGAD